MNTFSKLGVAFSLTVAFGVQAQQYNEAANVPFGSFDVTPTVDVGLRYTDNITRELTDTVSSWSRVVSPQILMESSLGTSQVSLAYRLRDEQFFSSSADNYTDHFFLAQANVEFNSRHRMIGTLNFEDGHDARGSNFSIGLGDALTEPDQYKQSEFDILYSYGAFNADGRLDINFDFVELDYDIDTPIYRARDRDRAGIGGTFYYRVGAVTDAVFEVRFTSVDFQFAADPLNPLDSMEASYLLGLEWEATAQTSGFAKIGYQTKDFDSALREDFSGVDWAVGVLWEPLEYSNVEFSTRSDTDETNGEGNFIESDSYQVRWRHEWLERVRSVVSLSYNNQSYRGQVIDGLQIREDDNMAFRASVYYQFRRWISFELGYVYDERDSNRDFINYDRNQLLLNALITL